MKTFKYYKTIPNANWYSIYAKQNLPRVMYRVDNKTGRVKRIEFPK